MRDPNVSPRQHNALAFYYCGRSVMGIGSPEYHCPNHSTFYCWCGGSCATECLARVLHVPTIYNDSFYNELSSQHRCSPWNSTCHPHWRYDPVCLFTWMSFPASHDYIGIVLLMILRLPQLLTTVCHPPPMHPPRSPSDHRSLPLLPR